MKRIALIVTLVTATLSIAGGGIAINTEEKHDFNCLLDGGTPNQAIGGAFESSAAFYTTVLNTDIVVYINDAGAMNMPKGTVQLTQLKARQQVTCWSADGGGELHLTRTMN